MGPGHLLRASRITKRDAVIVATPSFLETELHMEEGAVRYIDFMPPRGTNPDIVRIIEGLAGTVTIRMELIIRFDYGSIVPWVRRRHGGLEAVAGPDALILRTPVETHGEDLKTVAEFTVAKNERVPFVLTWFASHEAPPREIDPERALQETETYWRDWAKSCTHEGPWREAVTRSLITLKGLTYAPTGGMVAAPTTSLPGENRRRTQLGLPLLLAARCDLYPPCLTQRGFSAKKPMRGANGFFARSPERFAVTNHVRSPGRAPIDRVRAVVAAGI